MVLKYRSMNTPGCKLSMVRMIIILEKVKAFDTLVYNYLDDKLCWKTNINHMSKKSKLAIKSVIFFNCFDETFYLDNSLKTLKCHSILGGNYKSSIKNSIFPQLFLTLIFKKHRGESSLSLLTISIIHSSFPLLLNNFLFIIFCF